MFTLCVSISIPLIGPEWTVLSQWEDNIHILPLKVLCAIISPVTQELALHNLPHLLLTASPQCLSEFFNLTEYLLDLFSIAGHQLHFTQIPIITVIKWVDRLCSCWVDNIELDWNRKVWRERIAWGQISWWQNTTGGWTQGEIKSEV